ncbi:hypothetical protein [Oceanobacillus limi]|uniref:hypothetical protein n=1 Tax=Oceanobacillus limi TaxID=930131 RepID=UPI00147B073D|nr:hypothetical protein [Oceanobacillus limi]
MGSSLYYVKQKFIKLEVIITLLFLSFLCQHINFKLFSAYERLAVKEDLIPRVLSYLHFGIVLPILLLWLLYIWRKKIAIIYKVLLSFLWIGMDLLSKQVYVSINVLTSNTDSWYPIIDVCISLFILLLSLLFMRIFSTILEKESGVSP